LKVTISCCGKFHAFALAEQMQKNGQLNSLMTCYAYQRNTFLRRFVRRIDKEIIPASKIHSNIILAFPIKLLQGSAYLWLDLYDRWVAGKIKNNQCKVFIGWSGMSLHAIRAAKASGKITIIERGSSHIVYQNQILQEEYKKFGIDFSIDKRTIAKELIEYNEADYISVPSNFVRNSFLKYGFPESKLFMNPYGVSSSFERPSEKEEHTKFIILYVGAVSVQKGLKYLFEALELLSMKVDEYEFWLIGKVESSLLESLKRYKKTNWKILGYIEHYDLQNYMGMCDVAVQPSLQEGLSMVIPQLMSCGVPVIATTNTGGENMITDGVNGFIIPIRSPEAIADKIEYLFKNKSILSQMSIAASESIKKGFKWDDYGNRYAEFINTLS